jgi:carbon-monoxide dehydrogenase small subunit
MTTEIRPTISIQLTLNGQQIETTIEPRELLLDFLRDRLGLKGAKRSCDMQVCGTCTVLLDGQPVSSCCTLAYEAHGREVTTIEGLAQDEQLHPLQKAFIEQSGLQCGFCTAGMILTAKTLLDEQLDPSPDEIRRRLAGNLCRCTGYWNILESVAHAAQRITAESSQGGERA